MSYKERIEALELKLVTIKPGGLAPEKHMAFEEQKRRINRQLARLRYEQAESWKRQDWLALIENSLDLLGEKVAGWVTPHSRF